MSQHWYSRAAQYLVDGVAELEAPAWSVPAGLAILIAALASSPWVGIGWTLYAGLVGAVWMIIGALSVQRREDPRHDD